MTCFSRTWACAVGFCLLVQLHGAPVSAATRSVPSRPLDSGGSPPSTKAVSQRALDIVVVVDNSGSMGPKISSLEDELYDHLVALQIADGVDTRVIVVSKHGDNASESVCFESPLSSVPGDGCSTPPLQPGITDIFKHYSVEIGSLDSWCLLISTFDGTTPDEFALALNGWSEWLREGALKLILMMSDDGVMCGSFDDGDSIAGGAAAAAAIDVDLTTLSPLHFGTSSNRNYVVHSLVGLVANAPPSEPWPPSSPVKQSICPGAVSAGTGHQGMSILTGGLRFPVCSTTDFASFLEDVSEDTTLRIPIFSDGFESGNTTAWSSAIP